uniref:Transposase n=1 Tax=candidate division WWE3 bacterium TaxID=2053526 RepID=A0A831Z163_UNCKA
MRTMATPRRFFPAETFYHVYNRGNWKERVFFEPRDYQRFKERAKKYKTEYSIEILAYCLMPNHFHFLLKQKTEQTLPLFMLKLCTSYAKYINIKYQKVGRLFQDRFRAKPIEDERYLLWLSKYIHLNPEEISSKKNNLADYPWSSYPEYLTGKFDLVSGQDYILHSFSQRGPSYLKYWEFVEAGLSQKECEAIADLTLETL